MSRELKFKLWLPLEKRMTYAFDITELPDKTQVHDGVLYLQFTGLKDKGATDIFESDILEGDDGTKYIVVWIEQMGGWYLSIPNTHRGRDILSCAASKSGEEPMLLFKLKVIGNIHSNPTLLK